MARPFEQSSNETKDRVGHFDKGEMAHRHGVSSNELFATLQDWEYTLKRSPSALAIIKGEKIATSKVNQTSSSQTDLVIWQATSPAKYKRRPSRIAGG